MNINLKLIKSIKTNEGALCVIKFLWSKLMSQFLFKKPSLRLNNIHINFYTSTNEFIETQILLLLNIVINLLSNFGLGFKSPSFGN